MKKVILGLVGLAIVGIVVVIFYLYSNLDMIVKAAIEKYGSQATQTAVRVDNVRIKLTEGDGAIYGLTVTNPEGFEQKYAISLGETGLGIDLKSVKSEPYVINHITVRDPKIFFEINADKKANLNELKKNLGTRSTTSKDKAGDKNTAGPRLIIKRITFEQGSIDTKLKPLNKDYTIELPNINMINLGGSQGATAAELAREILQRLTNAALVEIKKKGIDAEIDKLKSDVKAKAESEKSKLKDEADSKLDDEKKKAEDRLKDMLR